MSLSVPEEAIDAQRRYNRQSATCWAQYADHRARVTRLAVGGGGGRVAVLGAGNCNDVDLPELCARFRQVHLVDIDAEALHRARGRQLPHTAASLTLRAPVDLSGAMEWLLALGSNGPSAAQIAALPETCEANVAGAIGDAFDVVVSACVLSQMQHSAVRILGVHHPDLAGVRSALALAHTRSMARLVKSGGTGVLVTDVCSSMLETSLEDRFAQCGGRTLLRDLERAGSILSGTGPSSIVKALAGDAVAPLASDVRVVEPWLWRMGPLVLLVYAIVFTRV